MPFKLSVGEAVPSGLRRIATEELQSAAALLQNCTPHTRDDAIHEARKSLKKTRALLRLISPSLAGNYRQENESLGDLGRKLSEFRDAAAMIEILDQFRKEYRESNRGRVPAVIRQELLRQKRAQTQSPAIVDAVRSTSVALTDAAGRVSGWPIEGDGFETIAAGLAKTYRRGRKGMAATRGNTAADYVHDWRKRAKAHWYHIRLLEEIWDSRLALHERSLKRLETLLGDHHNLEVLCQKLSANAAAMANERVRAYIEDMREYQRQLRRQALALGRQVYAATPARFLARAEQLWGLWQARAPVSDGSRLTAA